MNFTGLVRSSESTDTQTKKQKKAAAAASDYAAVFTLYGRYLKKSTSPNSDSAVSTGNGDAGADPWVFDSLEALIDSVRKDPRKAHVVTLSGFDEVYLMKPTGDTGKTGSGRLLWRPKLITSPVPGMP